MRTQNLRQTYGQNKSHENLTTLPLVSRKVVFENQYYWVSKHSANILSETKPMSRKACTN
jgi:hypothetical protein